MGRKKSNSISEREDSFRKFVNNSTISSKQNLDKSSNNNESASTSKKNHTLKDLDKSVAEDLLMSTSESSSSSSSSESSDDEAGNHNVSNVNSEWFVKSNTVSENRKPIPKLKIKFT